MYKIYNALAQLLFCSLHFLFGDFPVAVAAVGFLKLPKKFETASRFRLIEIR